MENEKAFYVFWYVLLAKSDVLETPFFGENVKNITALTDDTATLKCTVKNKGNRTVRHWVGY